MALPGLFLRGCNIINTFLQYLFCNIFNRVKFHTFLQYLNSHVYLCCNILVLDYMPWHNILKSAILQVVIYNKSLHNISNGAIFQALTRNILICSCCISHWHIWHAQWYIHQQNFLQRFKRVESKTIYSQKESNNTIFIHLRRLMGQVSSIGVSELTLLLIKLAFLWAAFLYLAFL